MKKTDLHVYAWLKDIAPSSDLRQWFHLDPQKWNEFRRRYFRELDANPDAVELLLNAARRGRVALVYSSHDTEHNNAVALKDYLETRTVKRRFPTGKALEDARLRHIGGTLMTTQTWPTFMAELRSQRHIAEGTMAFHFEKPAGWSFKTGQFVDITLLEPAETDSEGNKRGFSIASAPHEETLMVATRMRDTALSAS